MAENGLKRGENGLQVYVMCEIPSNVILAKAFAERFDGFSIGSNDLTQLTLGVDRDSEDLAALFDEQDEAVKWMIENVIREAHKAGAKVGLCGQAPSDHPEFAEFLVRCGIDSMSVSPDSFIAVKRASRRRREQGNSRQRMILLTRSSSEPVTDTGVGLIGDIGATNARFALVQPDGESAPARVYALNDYDSLHDAIEAYLTRGFADGKRPAQAALAVASPVTGDQVTMTNHPWTFSVDALRHQFGLKRLLRNQRFRRQRGRGPAPRRKRSHSDRRR